jgi:capsular polysaccharide transport system permease protein
LLMKAEAARTFKGVSKLRSLSPASLLFLGIVALPTAIGAVYFGLIASPRYVTEAKFIVRGVNGRQGGGLEALFRTFGISRAEDDAFAVHNFMQSRDAVRAINDVMPLRSIFARPGVDVLSRYPRFWAGDSFEALYEYYLQRVDVSYQPSTGISSVRVSAFAPDDAKAIADGLLKLSEQLINRMNSRAQDDALAYAESELANAEKQAIDSQRQITQYRNTELLIDPSAVSLKTLDLIASLTGELARTRLQLNEILQKSPSNPTIQGLRIRIEALEGQIAAEKSKIVGGADALASKIAAYERLALNREFAGRNLTAAFSTLETARQEGRRKHLYIETIASPMLPDEPEEPRRFRNVMIILFCGFCIFGMLWLSFAGSREQAHG